MLAHCNGPLPNVTPATLTVSIVTYRPDLALLDKTLRTLAAALAVSREQGLLRGTNVVLIDNTNERATAASVIKLGQERFRDTGVTMTYLHGHANIGYGAAHNLAMHGGSTNYHLVLNPDVELAPDALAVALRFLAAHRAIGVIAPASFRADGTREYLCKRYPSMLDLGVRGFAPSLVQRLFRRRLARYEMRHETNALPDAKALSPIAVMSGAFMFARRKAIDATGGFDPKFFLYFEDFDWSVRLNRVTKSAFVPGVHIVHHGGGARAKGARHILYFAKSAVRFFNKHGWKWT
jgi:GT2 family glycosyltransferase